MRLIIGFHHGGHAYLGISLCRGELRVAQHLLYGPEIDSRVQEMSRERMPQGVRRGVFRDAAQLGAFLYEPLNAPLGDASAVPAHEERAYQSPSLLQVCLKRGKSAASEIGYPLLAALAEHPYRTGREGQVFHIEPRKLAYPYAGRIKDLQYSEVPYASLLPVEAGRLYKAPCLFNAHHNRKVLLYLRGRNALSRVPLSHPLPDEIPEKRPDRGELPCNGDLPSPLVEPVDVRDYRSLVYLKGLRTPPVPAVLDEERVELGQVPPVRLSCVRRRVPLDGQVAHETLYQPLKTALISRAFFRHQRSLFLNQLITPKAQSFNHF